jgi:hypothetical protein
MKTNLRRIVLMTVGALLVTPWLPASAIIGGSADGNEHPAVGQLLFYVPDAVDSRFDEPGAWYNCTGTLIDATTVVTAGHCAYDVGVEGISPENPLVGGTDVWFSNSEVPDYSILPRSSTYDRDENDARYADWAAALDSSDDWSQTASTYTHPEYVDAAFLLHDVAVVKLSEGIVLDQDDYGTLPTVNYLDQYAGKAKERALFESVGYGLEDSGPKFGLGGDTRRKADRRLVSFKGAYGYRNISVMFAHAGGATTGGTCFGDSGGPTFDISTPAIESQNIIVAVTSFGLNQNCNASGSYRIDQPDDVQFLSNPTETVYN